MPNRSSQGKILARGDQLSRQWQIIQRLISSRTGKSVSELAADLDCHARTVYRDLSALQDAGFPLYTEKLDGSNRWAMLEGAKHRIPVPLSLTELTALVFGRGMVPALKGTVFHDALESLFEKLKTTLPPEMIRFLERVEQHVGISAEPHKTQPHLTEFIQVITGAISDRCCLTMDYYTMSRRKRTRRTVEPHKIWYFGGSFYLLGFCRLRGEERVFALDRIRKLETTEETFSQPAPENIDTRIRNTFGAFMGEEVTVRIRFSPDIAGYIKEKTWHESQEIFEEQNGCILFTARVAGIEEIKHWILRWGAKAEVISPIELQEAVRREVEAMAGIYSGKNKVE